MQVTSRKHGTKTQSGAFGKRKRLGIDPARALSPGDERVHALNIQYERARRHLPLFGKYGKIVREAQKAVNDGITIQYNKDKTGESGDGQ